MITLDAGGRGSRRGRTAWLRHVLGAATVVVWAVAGIELDFIAGNALSDDGPVGDVVLYAVIGGLSFGALGWLVTTPIGGARPLIPAWTLVVLLALVALCLGVDAALKTANDAISGAHLNYQTVPQLRAWVPDLYMWVPGVLTVLAITQRLFRARGRAYQYACVLIGSAPFLAAAYLIFLARS